MSQVTPISPERIDPRIVAKLGRLRGTVRRRLLAEGLAWVVIAMVGAVALTLLADYGLYLLTRLHMSVAQRLLVIMIALAGVVYLSWKRLIRPQLLHMSHDDLALVVERIYPELNDRLISSLQFSRVDDIAGTGSSAAMVDAIVRQTNEMALPLPFLGAIRWDHAIKRGAWALGGLLLVGLSWGVWPDLMGRWFDRNVLLRDVQYPRNTFLSIEGSGRFRVGRGSPLQIVVVADPKKTVPQQVTFHMRFGSVGAVDETVTPLPGAPHRFVKTIDVVAEPFTFYVTGGDDRTAEYAVEVAEPPQLREVGFTVAAPDYTHLKPQLISSAQGTIQIPCESTITVTGLATKDLTQAAVSLDGGKPWACDIKPDDARRPRQFTTSFKLATPKPFKSMRVLRFAMTDTEGFSNAEGAQYTLALVPDKQPTLQMAAVGVAGQVTRKALVPLEFLAKDDYGVRELFLEWSVDTAPDKRRRMGVALYEPDQKEPPAYKYVLDLTSLSDATGAAMQPATMPAGPALSEGESIRLLGIVQDSLPAENEGPNSGISNLVTLKIASDEEVLAALVEAQRSMREQFKQAIQTQSEARGKTDAAIERARAADGLGDAQQLAGEAADQQQQLNDRVVAVAQKFEEILAQMNNNRVGMDADKQRLSAKIIAPLREQTAGAMRKAAMDLLTAKNMTSAPGLNAELAKISSAQGHILVALEGVMGEMIKVENAQVVEHGLKEILRRSEEIKNMTRGGGATRPSSGPAGRSDGR